MYERKDIPSANPEMYRSVDRATVALGIGHDAEKRVFWRFTPNEAAADVFWHAVETLPRREEMDLKKEGVVARGSTAVLLADLLRNGYRLAIINEGERT